MDPVTKAIHKYAAYHDYESLDELAGARVIDILADAQYIPDSVLEKGRYKVTSREVQKTPEIKPRFPNGTILRIKGKEWMVDGWALFGGRIKYRLSKETNHFIKQFTWEHDIKF